jgi:hypothetical protein
MEGVEGRRHRQIERLDGHEGAEEDVGTDLVREHLGGEVHVDAAEPVADEHDALPVGKRREMDAGEDVRGGDVVGPRARRLLTPRGQI